MSRLGKKGQQVKDCVARKEIITRKWKRGKDGEERRTFL